MNRRSFINSAAALAGSLAVGTFSISNDPWIDLRHSSIPLDNVQDIARECGLKYMARPVIRCGNNTVVARTTRLEMITLDDKEDRIKRSLLIERLKPRLEYKEAAMLHGVSLCILWTQCPWTGKWFNFIGPYARIVTKSHLNRLYIS